MRVKNQRMHWLAYSNGHNLKILGVDNDTVKMDFGSRRKCVHIRVYGNQAQK